MTTVVASYRPELPTTLLLGLSAICCSEPALLLADAGQDSVPVECRNEAWRRAFIAQSDGGVAVDEAGRVVFDVDSSDVRVVLDPYGVTPLSAVVEVRSIAADCVRAMSIVVRGPDGDDLAATVLNDDSFAARYDVSDVEPGGLAKVPVLGLYPSQDNVVNIEVSEDGALHRATVTITTKPVPSTLPKIDMVTVRPPDMEPGFNLASFFAGDNDLKATPFIYDLRGRIRWVLLAHKAISPGFLTPMEPLRNGNLLLAIGNAVYEYSLLGREINRWLLPDGFEQHHDVHEMPDGHFLVCGSNKLNEGIVNANGERFKGSDEVIEIDRGSGAVRNRWDLRKFLDVDRYTYMMTGEGQDWFHLNSVVYSSEDDSIIVSGKHQGMAKISRSGVNVGDPEASKNLRWILAPHLGWEFAGFDGSGEDLSPYLLTAVDANGKPYPPQIQTGTASSEEFGWPYAQHAPLLLDNGDLFVFDNGFRRDLGHATHTFSRGVVYRIEPLPNGVGGKVRQVWEYGRQRGPELYAPVTSDVDVGSITGNRFVMPGSYTTSPDGSPGGAAKILEIRPSDGAVVFEAHLLMRGKREWGDDMCYRQERMPLFP